MNKAYLSQPKSHAQSPRYGSCLPNILVPLYFVTEMCLLKVQVTGQLVFHDFVQLRNKVIFL